VKQITNNSGTAWTRLANELLDPGGDAEDGNDPQPYPAFVPGGFSTSSDLDGLSFAQGSGLPRASDAFASVFEDELTDARDFLDFFTGSVPNGGTFLVTYGLRDNAGDNQPFLLVQRPNTQSRPEATIPEPATMFLVGGGLTALVRRRLKRKQ
ncbi:MAG TPA: PEP-CTERM sorting domain-containing protein, partial [Vicinamibacterales bacterium]